MIKLTTPISNSDVEQLTVGDKVLISGTIYTARDAAHMRLINEDNPKFEINGSVIFYVPMSRPTISSSFRAMTPPPMTAPRFAAQR